MGVHEQEWCFFFTREALSLSPSRRRSWQAWMPNRNPPPPWRASMLMYEVNNVPAGPTYSLSLVAADLCNKSKKK
jgi:hypothetical protein